MNVAPFVIQKWIKAPSFLALLKLGQNPFCSGIIHQLCTNSIRPRLQYVRGHIVFQWRLPQLNRADVCSAGHGVYCERNRLTRFRELGEQAWLSPFEFKLRAISVLFHQTPRTVIIKLSRSLAEAPRFVSGDCPEWSARPAFTLRPPRSSISATQGRMSRCHSDIWRHNAVAEQP